MNANMTTADMRSPLKALPNTGPRPGYPVAQTRFIKCAVVKVHRDPNGTPNLIFDVRPISDGATTGGANNDITDVPMLQPGFGNITDTGRAPSGIIFVPEVGSLVLCIFDGSRFIIAGFYTGPSKGELTRIQDKEQRLVTFNPGVEYALNRLIAPAKYDIPWLYGMDEGDIILGKDYTRLKLTDRGLFMSGGGTASLIVLKSDGERLDRWASYETRGIGYWQRHNFTRGTEDADSQNRKDPELANAPEDGSIYSCEIIETTPYLAAKAPYIVFEKGHISRGFAQRGRSAIYAVATAQVILEEKKKDDYAVVRVFIAKPIEKQPSPSEKNVSERTTSAQANELTKAAYEQFDLQLDVDGSFRMRAGNTSKIPKGQTVQPTKEMDFSCEYISKSLAFLLRIGKAGANITSIIANPQQIIVHTPSLIGKMDLLIDMTAKKSIKFTTKEFTIEAQKIEIKQGPVDIEKKLNVKDDIKSEKNIEAEKNIKADQKVIADQRMVSPQYKKRGGESPAAQTNQPNASICNGPT